MDIPLRDLVIVEKYVFLNEKRYRIRVKGTNIVFNVKADNDEEALEKTANLIRTTGLTKDIIESIRELLNEPK